MVQRMSTQIGRLPMSQDRKIFFLNNILMLRLEKAMKKDGLA